MTFEELLAEANKIALETPRPHWCEAIWVKLHTNKGEPNLFITFFGSETNFGINHYSESSSEEETLATFKEVFLAKSFDEAEGITKTPPQSPF